MKADRIRRLHRAGWAQHAIAAEMGLSPRTVRRYRYCQYRWTTLSASSPIERETGGWSIYTHAGGGPMLMENDRIGLVGTFTGFVATWMISPGEESEEPALQEVRAELRELRMLIEKSNPGLCS